MYSLLSLPGVIAGLLLFVSSIAMVSPESHFSLWETLYTCGSGIAMVITSIYLVFTAHPSGFAMFMMILLTTAMINPLVTVRTPRHMYTALVITALSAITTIDSIYHYNNAATPLVGTIGAPLCVAFWFGVVYTIVHNQRKAQSL